MRKGQAEIFGLIIIVILLIFALLFFVKTKQSDDSSVTLRSSFRANNLMNAIMDVNLGGNGNPSLKELMKDCIESSDASSGDCSSSNGNLIEIFGKTLLPSEKYEFTGSRSFNDPNPLINLGSGNCPEGITASPFYLPGDYVFQLKLCY